MSFRKFGASDDGRITEVDKPEPYDESLAKQASVEDTNPSPWDSEDEKALAHESNQE